MDYNILQWNWRDCNLYVRYHNNTYGYLPYQDCIDMHNKPSNLMPIWITLLIVGGIMGGLAFIIYVSFWAKLFVDILRDCLKQKRTQQLISASPEMVV